MVSKTRKRQLRRSNQENSFEQVTETPNVSTNSKNVSQNVKQIGPALTEIDINTMIKSAVEKELIKYGINVNANNVRDDVVQSSSRTNNQLIDNNEQSDVNSSRATHFIVNDGNIDHNRSREHNCPNLAALAKQNKTRLEQDNCHMATEMGLPRKRQ